MDGISFEIPLATAPNAVYRSAGAGSSTECLGTESAPAAARGVLCVYEAASVNATAKGIQNPVGSVGSAGASRWGAAISTRSPVGGGGDHYAYGTWAVTAG
jgi:hypothetical protein